MQINAKEPETHPFFCTTDPAEQTFVLVRLYLLTRDHIRAISQTWASRGRPLFL